MNELSCVVGEILPVEISHFGSNFSFIPETSIPAYWKVHLKMKGALLYFFSGGGVTIIIIHE